jgi:Tfp pilus assembly protein PilF
MKASLIVLSLTLVLGGCMSEAKPKAEPERTLRPPAGTSAAAATAVEEGNRLFAAKQWELAKAQYETAIKVQASLAEAHYNLALALEMLKDQAGARKHYIEAANLAPGHKVIWDSPPLRKHTGDIHGLTSKDNNFMDPKPY